LEAAGVLRRVVLPIGDWIAAASLDVYGLDELIQQGKA
jgi:hypothetical protein